MVFRRSRRTRSNAIPTSCQDGETHQAALHRLAERGMFDAILTMVLNSTPADWVDGDKPQQASAASAASMSQQPRKLDASDDSSAIDDMSVEDRETAPESTAVTVLAASPEHVATTTPLHLILAYQPPVAVVDSMIHIVHDRFSILSPEEYPDKEQKTPLHIAVENFCDPEVIERLLAGESLLVPALLRDRRGRCALHYNCCTSADASKRKKKSFFDRDPVAMDRFRQRQTLAILLEHYPEAAGLTDVDGKTPWDYAQQMKLEGVNVRYLQKMYDVFALKTPKKFEKHMTNSTTMDASDFSYNYDDEDLSEDELPLDLRSLNCSRHWKTLTDGDVSSIGDYEAELYNSATLDEVDMFNEK